ncbi:DNA polymerase alpha, subunit B like protein, partial [Aduncisulcus paluster]
MGKPTTKKPRFRLDIDVSVGLFRPIKRLVQTFTDNYELLKQYSVSKTDVILDTSGIQDDEDDDSPFVAGGRIVLDRMNSAVYVETIDLDHKTQTPHIKSIQVAGRTVPQLVDGQYIALRGRRVEKGNNVMVTHIIPGLPVELDEKSTPSEDKKKLQDKPLKICSICGPYISTIPKKSEVAKDEEKTTEFIKVKKEMRKEEEEESESESEKDMLIYDASHWKFEGFKRASRVLIKEKPDIIIVNGPFIPATLPPAVLLSLLSS